MLRAYLDELDRKLAAAPRAARNTFAFLCSRRVAPIYLSIGLSAEDLKPAEKALELARASCNGSAAPSDEVEQTLEELEELEEALEEGESPEEITEALAVLSHALRGISETGSDAAEYAGSRAVDAARLADRDAPELAEAEEAEWQLQVLDELLRGDAVADSWLDLKVQEEPKWMERYRRVRERWKRK